MQIIINGTDNHPVTFSVRVQLLPHADILCQSCMGSQLEKEEQYGENNAQDGKRFHFLKVLCQHFKTKINART